MEVFAPPQMRAVLSLTGSDSFSFLQGMITNDLELLATQNAIYAAFLSPQGKVLQTFFVVSDGTGGFLLDCANGDFGSFVKRLTMFRLRADVIILDVSAHWQTGLSAGPVSVENAISFADPRNSALGFRHIIPTKDAKPKPATPEFLAIRFAHFTPEQDLDFASDEVFVTDINMDLQNGIAWRKGCYVGQEVVSRVRRRGTIRKRICLAGFTGAPPAPGTLIFAGKAKLGHICSNYGTEALAMIRTDRLHQTSEPITAADMPLTLHPPKEIDL